MNATVADTIYWMVWFFELDGVQLQCEIRPAAEGVGFELVLTAPDGQVHVEQSEDVAILMQRRRQLEDLTLDDWKRAGHETPSKRFL